MSFLSKLFGSKKPERELKVIHDKYCDFTDADDVSEYKGTVKWHNYDCDICNCGKCFVDGGKDYVRYGAEDLDDVILLTEYEDEVNE